MVRLGDLDLEPGKARVAVSFSDIDSTRDVSAARLAGVAIAEHRIDLYARLTPDYVALQVKRLSGLPSIATIRMAEEGGEWRGEESERIALYSAVLPYVDAIDIELRAGETIAALRETVNDAGKVLVISHHNFAETPSIEVLRDVCARAVEAGADIVKIAALVRDDKDIAILSGLLEEKAAPNLVVIGMGEKGLPTRLAFHAKGSLFTFAAKGDRASAPGQISYARTLEILAELSTNPKTV